ncbi:MAG: SDR family oxidoreductase [Chloroflexi bacterium]|nr:SDR family oxidoreductase [Chloroflexota bacterium]
MDFTDKIVLVTGASRGIGRACARLFAEHGARVAVHYHANRTAADETLAALPGSGHRLVRADIANPAEVQAMVNAVTEQMGGLHVLVNNAGIYEKRPFADLSYDDWLAHWHVNIQTNLLGAANAAFCTARHMMQHGGGRIVNVSSRGAFRGEPDSPAYGAAKAGMNAMSQSLAKALAPYNIIVTAVAPGWVETDMAAEHLAQRGDEMRQQSPLGRIAQPEEIARAVLFLASEGTDFLTGAIVDINGASYLRT